MFSMTNDAATMIAVLRDEAGLAETAGLRIAVTGIHQSLHMRLAECPSDDDTVITCKTANIFLGPLAAARLIGQTLDGRNNNQGAAFYLSS